MGYEKAKGRGKKGHKHVQLWRSMQDSQAWQALSLPARCTWLEIMRRFNGYNNGEIALSCREVSELCHVSKSTASNAFTELIENGFIKVGQYSSFTCKYKKSRRWIITHYPLNKKAPTNEWRNWTPKDS